MCVCAYDMTMDRWRMYVCYPSSCERDCDARGCARRRGKSGGGIHTSLYAAATPLQYPTGTLCPMKIFSLVYMCVLFVAEQRGDRVELYSRHAHLSMRMYESVWVEILRSMHSSIFIFKCSNAYVRVMKSQEKKIYGNWRHSLALFEHK